MTMEFVSLDTWELIFTWVNLLILFLIMKKLLFKPIVNVMKERENEVHAMYENAENAKNEAQSLKEEYTKKLSSAREEASQIVKDAQGRANKEGDRIISDAAEKASAMLKKAENEIERERKAAVDEVKGSIASLAVDAAQKIIERDINESDYERLVEEYISSGGKDEQ